MLGRSVREQVRESGSQPCYFLALSKNFLRVLPSRKGSLGMGVGWAEEVWEEEMHVWEGNFESRLL